MARTVDVEIADTRIAMSPSEEGWWGVDVPDAGPGTEYRFAVDGGARLPDPRSSRQPHGVHGPSRMVDHAAFPWSDQRWQPPPLAAGVIYELHVGTFTRKGTFASAIERLAHLIDLGVTHVELMPVAEFSGARGWGYDGVDLFAPHHAYGGPDGLKRLVNACHERGLAVLLEVVYNHLGPAGNYLGRFGPYFTDRYATPWGEAVNFDGRGSDEVRRFVFDNARAWIEDYHIDGLRVDAVHAIFDRSALHVLEELAGEVRALDREALRERAGTEPSRQGQRAARHDHGQERRHRIAVDPLRGGAGPRRAQFAQRIGVGQRQVEERGGGLQDEPEEGSRAVGVEKGALPGCLVLEGNATDVHAGHDARGESGRPQMEQQAHARGEHRLRHAHPAARIEADRAGRRRGAVPAASARDSLRPPCEGGGQSAPASARDDRVRAEPSREMDGQQRVNGQVPGEEAEKREGEDIDPSLRAEGIDKESGRDGAGHHRRPKRPREPRQAQRSSVPPIPLVEPFAEPLGPPREHGLRVAARRLDRLVGGKRPLLRRQQLTLGIDLLHGLDEQDPPRLRLAHRAPL